MFLVSKLNFEFFGKRMMQLGFFEFLEYVGSVFKGKSAEAATVGVL